MKALSILCEHHAEARDKFVERASIGQLAKELESSDVQVCNLLHCDMSTFASQAEIECEKVLAHFW